MGENNVACLSLHGFVLKSVVPTKKAFFAWSVVLSSQESEDCYLTTLVVYDLL